MRIAVLPGDGIGPEVVREAVKVLRALGLAFEFEEAPVGAAGVAAAGTPLPPATLDLARHADAILFGAVGGFEHEEWLRVNRVQSGVLQLRTALGLYANLRPVKLFEALIGASSLRPERVRGLDVLIVRELTGDIYFGEPRGITEIAGERTAFNTMRYSEAEIARVAHVAFRTARRRRRRVCSVDKANVLETMWLWRDVVTEVGRDYPDVELTHLYVDAAAIELIRAPVALDVVVTGNLFGDILSDEAAMLTGSIGMLPSASLGEGSRGLFEPIHGSAPDIAGQGIANPLAAILSAAMMLETSLGQKEAADRIVAGVARALDRGCRTRDIMEPGGRLVGTEEMGDAVAGAL